MANKSTRSLSARKGLDKNLFEEITIQTKNDNATEGLKSVADTFLVDDSLVAGTASFYDFTREENRKHKIFVCNGTACMCANTQNELIDQLKNNFKEEEIGHAACVGHCHTNSAFMYNDQTFSASSKEDIDKILSHKAESRCLNNYKVDCNTTPILTDNISDITNFFAFADELIDKPETVIQEIKTSNLRGRGGAGFPFWFKLDAVIKEPLDSTRGDVQKYIVCNADEGDPGAFSDMYLLEQQPYKVLFGMYISGLTVGANTGVLYIRGEYPNSIRTINESINFLNKNNLTPNFKWKIIRGQCSCVCGE